MADVGRELPHIGGDAAGRGESSVIVANDAIDVLRHGWSDAAGIFTPDRPEIAELLQARLEMVIAGGVLDETHLLGAIADVPDLATAAGSSSGPALALRLRRTVYEYLLALDAAPTAPSPVLPAAAPTVAAAPVEEVAAVGHRSPDGAPDAGVHSPDSTDAVGSSWLAEADRDADEDAAARDGQEPLWSYEPADTDALWIDAGDQQSPATVQVESLPLDEPATSEGAEPSEGFVAQRDGFHIVEETHPTSVPGSGPATPFLMPDFDEPDTTVAPVQAHGSSNGHTPVAESRITEDQGTAAGASLATSGESPATSHTSPPLEVAAENGWRVRGDTAAEGRGDVDEDPFNANPHLSEVRQRIQDRLRRKRCDEAAALLQELAAEPGGRAVAELAMDAGDRCQSLGKSNAALNCFLAASRADPVYELPLSRLADICIDDQDTDLAVSYLERVARLYKFKGDDRALLRVYRRIATIAPYREDILQALLTAQNTGRIDS